MRELIAHMIGDYILQTDKQASLKRVSASQAIFHAATYTLPFLALTRKPKALAVIFATHAIIDHYSLARYVVRLKNSLGAWEDRERFNTPTGYPDGSPDWLKTWLLIAADNTLHILINHVALRGEA